MPSLPELLWGTVVHRPYVWGFFLAYAVLAIPHLGWRRGVTFTISTYLIAFAAEYSSTRNGIPFGLYHYIEDTRTRELWISNVPFWDSLSFVFLSYFSFVLAATLLRDRGAPLSERLLSPITPILGGVLMMLLDVVIDPITLRGDRWFLGRVYYYPDEGAYFGVTLTNFAGGFVVGLVSQLWFQTCVRWLPWCRAPWRELPAAWSWLVFAVYAGVLLFMLAVTIAVGEESLIVASAIVTAATLGAVGPMIRRRLA